LAVVAKRGRRGAKQEGGKSYQEEEFLGISSKNVSFWGPVGGIEGEAGEAEAGRRFRKG